MGFHCLVFTKSRIINELSFRVLDLAKQNSYTGFLVIQYFWFISNIIQKQCRYYISSLLSIQLFFSIAATKTSHTLLMWQDVPLYWSSFTNVENKTYILKKNMYIFWHIYKLLSSHGFVNTFLRRPHLITTIERPKFNYCVLFQKLKSVSLMLLTVKEFSILLCQALMVVFLVGNDSFFSFAETLDI